MTDIVTARLRAQRLTGTGFRSAVDAVRWFGAVQSQDYAGAKWALGMRITRATEAEIDAAYDAGAILRTHVLRPTWHFVVPDDIRWMLELSGPRINQAMAGRFRELGLDARTIARAHRVFEKALDGERHMTRAELAEVLKRARIAPDGQRLPYLLFSGELAGVLTSGPRQGRQLSFALLDERAPKSRSLTRDEAIAELTKRYFVSHGPAQVRDLAWWSGLTQADIRRGLDMAGDALARREIDGVGYWFDAGGRRPAVRLQTAHLLPNFDEYTVGYNDRAAILHPDRPFRPELFAFSSILSNVVTIDGQACGSWRRLTAADRLTVEVRLLAEVSAAERGLIADAGRRLSRFLGRRVELVWIR